jgi:hypothetical protein
LAWIGVFAFGLAPTAARSEVQSKSWSGFLIGTNDIGFNQVGGVEGTWNVPAVQYNTYGGANLNEEVLAVWIGIGGSGGDKTLVQVGTASHAESDGTVTYFAWYELVGSTETPKAVTLTNSCYSRITGQTGQCPVQPGDQMEGYLFCSSGGSPPTCGSSQVFSFTLWNNTQGWVWSHNSDPYMSSLNSAEWIVEMPPGDLLPSYQGPTGPVIFTDAQAGAVGLPDHFNPYLTVNGFGWQLTNPGLGALSTPCDPTFRTDPGSGVKFFTLPIWYGPACRTPSAARTHDFNADGMADTLWVAQASPTKGSNPSIKQDSSPPASNAVAVWLMDGGTVSQAGNLGAIASAWSVIGERDFNGDGYSDLLWRDTSGDLAMWLMNGLTVASAASLGSIPATWTVNGTADLNGDGKGDILWRDSAGDVVIWFMNGSTVSSTASLGNVPTNWSIAGDDSNGNIYWRDTAGDVAVWQMEGPQVVGSVGLGNVPTSWTIAGFGDFDGDGNIDILWRDNSGDVAIWFLNGNGGVASTASLGTLPTTWTVGQTGDYNGDSMSDILWIDSSGDLAIWFMNGATVASTASLGNVGTAWQVQSANAE